MSAGFFLSLGGAASSLSGVGTRGSAAASGPVAADAGSSADPTLHSGVFAQLLAAQVPAETGPGRTSRISMLLNAGIGDGETVSVEDLDALGALALEGVSSNPEEVEAAARIPAPEPVDPTRIHPELRARLTRVIERMEAAGHEVEVIEGYRTHERQQALFEQGRSMPGPVVTWTRNSQHSRGRAVDVMVNGGWEDRDAYRELQRIAAEEGLSGLGERDLGHLELRASGPEFDDWTLPASDFRQAVTAGAPTGADARSARAASPAQTAAASPERAPAQPALARVARVAQVARVATVARVASPRGATGSRSAPTVPSAPAPIDAPAPRGIDPLAAPADGRLDVRPAALSRAAVSAESVTPAPASSSSSAGPAAGQATAPTIALSAAAAQASPTPDAAMAGGARQVADAPGAEMDAAARQMSSPSGTASEGGEDAGSGQRDPRQGSPLAAPSMRGRSRERSAESLRPEPIDVAGRRDPESLGPLQRLEAIEPTPRTAPVEATTSATPADRASQVEEIRDLVRSSKGGSIRFDIPGPDGENTRVRLGMLRGGLDAALDVRDPEVARNMRGRIHELHRALESHSIRPARLSVNGVVPALEPGAIELPDAVRRVEDAPSLREVLGDLLPEAVLPEAGSSRGDMRDEGRQDPRRQMGDDPGSDADQRGDRRQGGDEPEGRDRPEDESWIELLERSRVDHTPEVES